MTRRGLAFVAIGLCSSYVLFEKWVLGNEHSKPWFVWLPVIVVMCWSIWQLREPPDPNSKGFDFNPKRGVLFFFLGFLIFPITFGMDAIFGAEMSVSDMSMMTAGGSVLIGLLGTFTEHVGV